jgi:hypothetical protein
LGLDKVEARITVVDKEGRSVKCVVNEFGQAYLRRIERLIM